MNKLVTFSAVVCSALFSLTAIAQSVEVQNAWARATVQGQKATGAFMTLKSKGGARLMSVSSSVAGAAEVHEMKMSNNVMSMRAVEGGLELPAGKAVELKPGGYHIMLLDLKKDLPKDSTVPLTLVFKDAKGAESKSELEVPVSNMPPKGAPMPSAHHSAKGMHHGH